jgi:hypothetical protein
MWNEYRERAARQAETERNVLTPLSEADTLLQQGWKEVDDPERWQSTLEMAQQSMERAKKELRLGDATAQLAERVEATESAVDEAAAACSAKRELDAIRLEMMVEDDQYYETRCATRFRVALEAYGVHLNSLPEAVPILSSGRLRGSRRTGDADPRHRPGSRVENGRSYHRECGRADSGRD